MLELLGRVHDAAVVKLHIWRAACLIWRLHFNGGIDFALQLRGATEIAHGTAAEVAARGRYHVLIVIVL